MKTNASREIVEKAIALVNKEHNYKIALNRADQTGKWFNFTLKSPSGIPGARLSSTGRKLACASWHAHGYVIDNIFDLNGIGTIIYTLRNKLTSKSDNWQDIQIGSGMNPCYFSNTSIL